MVKDKPPIEEVLPKFIEFIGGLPLVAHNIEFDLNINYKIIMDSEISKKSKIISNLENEIQELDNLIFELKRMKNESIC